ncbi:MAG: carbohydrate-binding protein [Spirochaetales bacterium]|nr:carbohydrate-binding protein [Spirochaetales bacterium]
MKKKLVLIFLTMLLLSGLSAMAAELGDVNTSGRVDIVDGLLIAQYYVKLVPENFDASVADVNDDQLINIVDSLLIAQLYVGLISELPGKKVSLYTIEAETGFCSNGVVESEYSGFSGTGYVNTTNVAGSYLDYRLRASEDGSAKILLYYANGGSSSRPMGVEINSASQKPDMVFAATNAWDNWQVEEKQIPLKAGENLLKITSLSDDGAPNLDRIEISFSGSISIPQPTEAPTPAPISYDLVVAKDGSGQYHSVQKAIDAAPNNRTSWYTIFIKNGVYHEVITIPAAKTYLQLIGENTNNTILQFNNYAGITGTTNSASVFANSNNFLAMNLTFENSFDYNSSTAQDKQAVALSAGGHGQIFLNCRMIGYQDTLMLRNKGRSYFQNCFIQGHVDFIFGDGTAVFKDCEIRSRNRAGSSIAAPSTFSSTSYGLIFMNCRLTADSGLASNSVYLGRPWHPSSATEAVKSNALFIYCQMGSHIHQKGWTSMSGVNPETERLWEYSNSGSGAVINSSRPQLSSNDAAKYTVANILGASDNWNPEAIIAALIN